MSLYVFHNVLKSVQRLCGLGVETDVFAEIQFPCLFLLFDDDGLSGGLSYQTQYFGVSIFALFHNLLVAVVFLDVLLLNLLLQAEYDRAGCVNDFYIVAAGNVISFRGLSMSTQQHFGVVEVVEFLMVDGNQPHCLQAFHFTAVVHDVSQTIEGSSFRQFLFCLVYCGDNSETEAGAFVYFYFCHIRFSSSPL